MLQTLHINYIFVIPFIDLPVGPSLGTSNKIHMKLLINKSDYLVICMMSNTGARAQTELIWNIIWHQYDRYRSLGFQSWPCIYRSCLGDCYTPPPPPAGNLKALDLRLPVTPGRLGLKRQHGDLLRVAGEEDSVFFHVGFFSRMTVRTCFVLAAFVAGLQRAVSGCVTAHCNG